MLLALSLAPLTAQAGEFMDVWVTTAFEDDNVRAGPEYNSPSANFVSRGNRTFFENYETRSNDDISRAQLVLYRADDGNFEGWSTETALVLRYSPYLDPDMTDPGVDFRDDGSYVRVIRALDGEDHNLSLTGYAVDAGRFRLGYSYDLTWGGREIHQLEPGAAPGVRLQWQKGGSYLFAGAKSAIVDYRDPENEDDSSPRNQALYGLLGGGGIQLSDKFKVEAGLGSFQQGQLLYTDESSSELFGEMIKAMGAAGQVAFRTNPELSFIESADLRLYKNGPDFAKDTYIHHRQLDGVGVLVQAEVDHLWHNLLNPEAYDETVIERATAGDVQTLIVINTTEIGVDLVYKDLSYILFNVPGLTSGVALDPDMEVTPQIYGRVKLAHYLPTAHLTPAIGMGIMQPATYKSIQDGSTFVQYSDSDKEKVPDGQDAAAILSAIVGAQLDMSKSVVFVGELLYTVDNNQSVYVSAENDDGEIVDSREPAPDYVLNEIGFNLMMRARF